MLEKTAYQTVETYFRRISRLQHARNILGWDEAVMMPIGGGDVRSKTVSELAAIEIELYQSREFAQALGAAQNENLNPWQQANLKESRKAHARQLALDPNLVVKKTLTAMNCEQLWRKLRVQNNWSDFVGLFSELVELVREESRQRAKASELSPYEAMMDLYEPGLRLKTVERVFGELREVLPGLIDEVIARQKQKRKIELGRPVPASSQKAMMKEFMTFLGFNFEHGRLDESHHPFCGGVPQDVRMTTRYSEDDFLAGLMGVIHETGHALYEQGLPTEWLEQPVGQARGMAIHESQSLFMEMQVARSREFAEFALPILKRHLSEPQDDPQFWTAENLFRHISHVEKGLIRVDADEVTYPAHVILRFEIEKGLIEGDIQVRELPQIWHEKMQQYLGLSTLGHDKNGCMQDVHWPSGAFGYFPSYSLGALTAAQLFRAMKKTCPEAREKIRLGEIEPLRDWLRQKVWSQGSFYSSDELLTAVTGAPLSVEPYLDHIRDRYLRD